MSLSRHESIRVTLFVLLCKDCWSDQHLLYLDSGLVIGMDRDLSCRCRDFVNISILPHHCSHILGQTPLKFCIHRISLFKVALSPFCNHTILTYSASCSRFFGSKQLETERIGFCRLGWSQSSTLLPSSSSSSSDKSIIGTVSLYCVPNKGVSTEGSTMQRFAWWMGTSLLVLAADQIHQGLRPTDFR